MSCAPRPRPGPRLLASALVLLVGLAAGGCNSDEEPTAESGPELVEPTDAPTLEIEPVTQLGRVTGRLPRQDARAVESRVSRVAVRWLTGAYVGGSWPRERFDDAFTGFTKGAAAAARSDRRVMTNADIGKRVKAITPTKVDVRVDVLAVRKRAVGATAHVLTTFRADGPKQGRYRVAGRLLLTKDHGRWTVFGYHVNKGGR